MVIADLAMLQYQFGEPLAIDVAATRPRSIKFAMPVATWKKHAHYDEDFDPEYEPPIRSAYLNDPHETAAQLQKVRASLNTSDVAAVKKFDLDVAAYTQRNHAAAALQAKYIAQAGK